MILAIDPGWSTTAPGAAALYDGATGELVLWDLPTYPTIVAGRERDRIDEHATIRIVRAAAANGATVMVIEQVGGMPNQAAAAAFVFGYGVGVLTAAAYAVALPIERVAPATWKTALKVPREKGKARTRASEMLPAYAHEWALQKHHGRAEAALLAVYGWRVIGPGG